MTILTVSSARSEVQVIYYIWKWLYSVASPTLVPVKFSAFDKFVLFDSLDGNGALFANMLCNIPISLIHNFGWKQN